jgi:pyridoxamine 5'-phosphate oxidase
MGGDGAPGPETPIHAVRSDYDRGALRKTDLDPDPLAQLRRWLDDATAAGVPEPTAMAISTVDPDGRPSSRNVLLRGLDDGLVFFTNYESAKAVDLAANPRCAALFSWLGLQRQVRVDGSAARLDEAASDAYFAQRPRGSQIGAWASPQSRVLADRAELEASVVAAELRFATVDAVPRPPNWGGFRITPERVEFWQGRPNRLHDRLRYRRDPAGGWVVERLAP